MENVKPNRLTKSEVAEKKHEAKIMTNQYIKKCQEMEIPVFVAYFIPGKGYQYNAYFPEEIGTQEIKSEYGKFNEFLRVCIDFNKEDYFPHINEE